MTRARLAIATLVAVLPLAGCGNKGPLILTPEPQTPPPQSAVEFVPAPGTTLAPAAASSIAPPAPATTAPPANADGTSGTPR